MNGYIADNLFQYVAARLIAERLGYALEVSHSPLHPESNVPQLLEFLSHCADAPLSLAGKSYAAPIDYSAHMDHGGFDGFKLDLDEICASREQRRLEVRGYFQNYAMLRPHKAEIRSWLHIKPCNGGRHITPQDIVLHVRRGDFIVFDLAMSLEFYTQQLDKLQFDRLYVLGCGLDEELRQSLAPYEPIYIQGTPAEDFRFMLSFRRMLLSNSGFSWWAGFLSDAEQIYAPLMGVNSRTEHSKATMVDLKVDDESRYHYTADVPYLERDYTLRDLLASRNQLRKKRFVSSLGQLIKRKLSGST
jgi:hypothetical protein